MMSSPVAFGSSVPQCPTFLIPNSRRIASTTSCDVGPEGLSIKIAPSSAENSCMRKLLGSVQCRLDGRDHLTLHRKGFAGNPRACCCFVAAASEQGRDFVHVDFFVLGTK